MVGAGDTMTAGSKWHNGQQWDYGELGALGPGGMPQGVQRTRAGSLYREIATTVPPQHCCLLP